MEKLQLILSLIEGTNDLIHSVTPDGSFEFVNQAWLKSLGYKEEEIKSLNMKDIIFPGQVKRHSELLGRILAGEKMIDVEVTFLTKGGEKLLAEGNLFSRSVNDVVVSATGFFRDVTVKKEMEEKLAEARARTEFFVDLMVHDITNINQEVISTIEILLLEPDFPEQLKDLIQEALTEVERGSNLIENVRKIASLASMAPKEKFYDLWTIMTTAAEHVNHSFPEKELAMETNISMDQYRIKADEYFHDVFFSLLHNSTKFDKKQKVKVEVQVEEIKHTPFIRIELSDFGPGIADTDKDSIFAKISHRRDSLAGIGLSLSLVKMTLDNYGAFIRVEDRVEGDYTKGAKFVILLRYEPSNAKPMEVDE